ncbi:hypothetical protein, partial [uncultured Rhodoblastus sp.]|uniref:hypothetical protein n=1 Tax=uncultured Rhodoblastus sp. TaxID=543037 RepID=UPI0025FCB012
QNCHTSSEKSFDGNLAPGNRMAISNEGSAQFCGNGGARIPTCGKAQGSPRGLIQRACDVDEFKTETYLTVVGRFIRIRASLDEFRDVLTEGQER